MAELPIQTFRSAPFKGLNEKFAPHSWAFLIQQLLMLILKDFMVQFSMEDMFI
jgi:hypothetical protein